MTRIGCGGLMLLFSSRRIYPPGCTAPSYTWPIRHPPCTTMYDTFTAWLASACGTRRRDGIGSPMASAAKRHHRPQTRR